MGINMFKEAIMRPFLSPGKLILLVILFMIPIVNFIFFGFIYECIRTAYKGEKALPNFKNYGSLFVKGLKMFIISGIYTIPVYLFMSIATIFYLAVDDLLGFPLYALSVLVAYLLPIALINFVVHEKMIFAFQDILKKAFTKLYIKTIIQLLLLVIPYFAVSSIISFLLFNFLGSIDWLFYVLSFFTVSFFSVLYQITSMTILAQVYKKI